LLIVYSMYDVINFESQRKQSEEYAPNKNTRHAGPNKNRVRLFAGMADSNHFRNKSEHCGKVEYQQYEGKKTE